ncbi:J domain-containing protein [Hymenobacter radiodurans]|uniref:J domain-containing protein n=1 Tax=Hymenobacter radiodurans TaxID=2496028 RepID=UPI001058A26D|nr:J domain-containing protein [Hymenobacter radiodurans]
MITHYEALEVSEQASAADIRQAYRRLVLLTHPDRTQDPAAHERYLAVNRAYEILSLPDKRKAYDARLWALRNPPSPVVSRPVVPRHPDPAYRGPMPRPVRRVSLQERYAAQYARVLGGLRPIMLGSLALCLTFIIDYSLAYEQVERIEESLFDVYYSGGSKHSRGTRHTYFHHRTDQGRFDSDESIALGEAVRVERTPIIGKALQVVRSNGQYIIPMNLYTESLVMPLLLFISAGLTQIKRLGNDARLGTGLMTLVLLIVTLYLLISA